MGSGTYGGSVRAARGPLISESKVLGDKRQINVSWSWFYQTSSPWKSTLAFHRYEPNLERWTFKFLSVLIAYAFTVVAFKLISKFDCSLALCFSRSHWKVFK